MGLDLSGKNGQVAPIKLTDRLFALIPSLVSLVITPGINYEIVNLSKFLLLCSITSLVIFNINWKLNKSTTKEKIFYILAISMFFWMSLSIPFSNTPLTEQLFGVFGRFTGLITYLCLILCSIYAFQRSSKQFAKTMLKGLIFVGAIEIAYVEIQFFGVDPVNWSNKNKWIVGTMGNPDYLSAFLAFILIASFAQIISQKSLKNKLSLSILCALGLHCLVEVGATQGFVILFASLSIMFLIVIIRSQVLIIYKLISILIFLSISTFIFAATLNVGPFRNFIYESSISRRGQLWTIALRMIRNSPIFGFGMDSYSHEYRVFRSPEIVKATGFNRVSNSSHNIFLDLGVNAGIPLILLYSIFIIFIAVVTLKTIIKSKQLDSTFLTLFGLWLAFNFQSLISVNVIGLSIWGFIVSGALLGYTVESKPFNYSGAFKKSSFQIKAATLVTSTFLIISGCSIFIKDIIWSDAIRKMDVDKILTTTKSWPQDSSQIDATTDFLVKATKLSAANELSEYAITFDDDNYYFWENKLNLTNKSSDSERLILSKIRKLEPNYSLK